MKRANSLVAVLVVLLTQLAPLAQRKTSSGARGRTIPQASATVNEEGKTPYDYVNPFIGTDGEGHTYPGATVPFGMVQLSPETDAPHFRGGFRYCAGYQYGD